MSMSPNNPFEDPKNAQSFAQSPARPKGGKGCLIGCSIAGVLGVMVCCGGGVMLIFVGVSVLADEYQRQLAGNPVIIEHIGDIESMEASWSTTIEEAQKSGDQAGGAPIAFEIKGSAGSGTVLIQQDQGGGSGMKSATLILPDGTRVPIDVSATPSGIDDLDDLDELIDPGEIAVPEPATAPAPVTVPEPAQAQPN